MGAETRLREDALACLAAAVQAVDPERLVRETLKLKNDLLPEKGNVYLISIGKASRAMAQGADTAWAHKMSPIRTADLAWVLLMATARRVVEADEYMRAGRYKLWGPNLFLGADISPGGSGERKTLGIVGYGRIGHGMAKRSTGFDMDVLAFDPYAKERIENDDLASWAELDELLEKSDFVTLHPLLTDETHHLISEAQLKKMKPTAILINAARGPIIDEVALVKALQENWIAGAGLDVFEDEPAMKSGLAECKNAVIVPHIASASIDTRAKMAILAATNAVAHLKKEKAPNCVNPGVYETDPYKERIG